MGREFSDEKFKIIDSYCKKKKIPWFVSCWDTESQINMRKFKTRFNKVASAMLIHEKLLNIVAEEQKQTFISTGMSTLKDIEGAVKIFRKHHCPFILMHSNSSYPMKNEEANLRVIQTLKKKFHCNVGYSGHETGASTICIASVMLGAVAIERHITIDRTLYGYDQAASLEPEGMKRLVRDLRLLDIITGDGKKRIWDSEIPNMKKLRQRFV
jgi:N-acetylneuraminate synthase